MNSLILNLDNCLIYYILQQNSNTRTCISITNKTRAPALFPSHHKEIITITNTIKPYIPSSLSLSSSSPFSFPHHTTPALSIYNSINLFHSLSYSYTYIYIQIDRYLVLLRRLAAQVPDGPLLQLLSRQRPLFILSRRVITTT